MIMTYNESIEQLNGISLFKKALSEGKLYKLEKGIYSNQKYETALSILAHKYPKAVLTLNSAFYYHGLTDVIPESYYFVTDKDSSKIKDIRVTQSFDNSGHLMLGAVETNVEDTVVLMYNRERMLVELIRNKPKLPFDYYKEIIRNYREIINDLDIQAIQEYAEQLPKTALVKEVLRMEVL